MSSTRIKTAIESLSGAINADPGKARAKATPATARLVDGLRSEVTGPKGERILTDMPPAMGGEGSSPNPGWYLRASVLIAQGRNGEEVTTALRRFVATADRSDIRQAMQVREAERTLGQVDAFMKRMKAKP